jgi:hypothetical protein
MFNLATGVKIQKEKDFLPYSEETVNQGDTISLEITTKGDI